MCEELGGDSNLGVSGLGLQDTLLDVQSSMMDRDGVYRGLGFRLLELWGFGDI